ncbi:MAG TPA: glycerate kinase [Anditalea sp.]|nr:glycerate kinase [Anditalea sp.]
MNILIAPNAFKGTMTAEEAAKIIREAISEIYPEYKYVLCPIADGGDGTSCLLAKALHLPLIYKMALNAVGRPILGYFAMSRDGTTAFMDVSTVSGIQHLKKEERDPFCAGTYGTGELIDAAVAEGAKEIVLGLGGTASIDMGIGILRGLGFSFLDEYGREIPMYSPSFLAKVRHIQKPIKKLPITFILLCDVQIPFFGDNGAIPIFGPQKGLAEDQIQSLEDDSSNFFKMLQTKSKEKLEDQPGFGAAGGIAVGLSAFFPTKMVNGSDYFFNKVQMDRQVQEADFIITGEGKYDTQSAEGKGSFKLMQLAQKYHKKIFLITSGNDPGTGFHDVIYLPPLGPKKESDEAKYFLHKTVMEFFKMNRSAIR